jgi:hypothetical protein
MYRLQVKNTTRMMESQLDIVVASLDITEGSQPLDALRTELGQGSLKTARNAYRHK